MPDRASELVLVEAPVGRDAVAIAQVLRSAGIDCLMCADSADLLTHLEAGAGAAILAEEAIARSGLDALAEWAARQQSWSDFPFLVLTSSRTTHPSHLLRQSLVDKLGHVALLARPLTTISLVSAVQASLRARRRQYEVWRLLAAQRSSAELLEQMVNDRTRQLLDTNRRLRSEMAERRQAEMALQQAQKMEVVGQMTGGIAHDFNNLLTAVIGNVDLALRRSADPRMTRLLDGALKAARRGAKLTSQLLAFARKQRLSVEATDLNALIIGMMDLLRRSVGPAVRIDTALAGDVWPAMADQGQVELVILNLTLNARDAMPKGGRITIATANSPAKDGDRPASLALAGDYVAISVTDTGCGMNEAVLAKIFEPFFTTKPPGAGTGLGLSQVYGVIRQLGGQVHVRSAIGKGSTFTLYLPKGASVPLRDDAQDESEMTPAGTAHTVLVVDDDEDVRAFTVACLESLGYVVLEAESGGTAIALLERHPDVDLLLIDVIMPEIRGPELAHKALAIRPDAQVLFMSGYIADADRSPLEHRVLSKPFTVADLASKVEEALREAQPLPANVTRLRRLE
ncbi:MAG: ATP-binding protein [Hyphomicrobiaceae bacterium]